MKTVFVLGCAALVAACTTYEEARVGSLGSTVQAVHYQQIADKTTAAEPGTALPPGADGPRTERVLKGYREAHGDAERVAEPIRIRFER